MWRDITTTEVFCWLLLLVGTLTTVIGEYKLWKFIQDEKEQCSRFGEEDDDEI